MNNFSFYNPVKIFFGKNSPAAINKLVTENSNVMIVYGSRSAKRNGSYDGISAELKKLGCNIIDFGGNKEALLSNVKKGIRLCRKEKISCVIGIGGGVAMDIAKAIAFGVKHIHFMDYLDGKRNPQGKAHLLIGAVPTYPASGSEVDDVAEIYDDTRKVYKVLRGVFPDFAIQNPIYTCTLLNKRTEYAAVVSFCQMSVNFLGTSSVLTHKVVVDVLQNLKESVFKVIHKPDDYESRSSLMLAASLSTMGLINYEDSFNWGKSLCDETNFIRSLMEVSYREAVSVLFPRWLKAHSVYHGQVVKDYMVSVMDANVLENEINAIDEGYKNLLTFFASLGMPMKYNAYGIVPSEEKIRKAAEDFKDKTELTAEELTQMVLECLE